MRYLLLISISGLFNFSFANAQTSDSTCGLSGTLMERVADCAKKFQDLSSKKIPMNDPFEPNGVYEWNLVTRTVEKKQIWFDATSQLVWADTAFEDYTFQNSLAFCHSMKHGLGVKGAGQRSLTGKNLLTFTLPSQGQLRAALIHGALEVLPNWRNNEGIFWTSSAGNSYSVCSSTHTQGYYTGSTDNLEWVPGYYSYSCAPEEMMTVLKIVNNSPDWNMRTLSFGHTGAVKCVARADE